MSNIVLRTRELTKTYSGKPAVDCVNMTIKKGEIYGLIGKNGAGKTTLIRMITSLTGPNSGILELFGESDPNKMIKCRHRMGCVVESPAFYEGLSAAQNLEYYCIFRGITDKKTVSRVLEITGLSDTGKKKYKNFSLGMKQRLGLAYAIMNHPDFIILDEPINGLDPVGIIEIRNILKRLNEEYNITILLSSHILSELSQVATRYGIINDGKLIKEFNGKELNDQCQKYILVKANDVNKAAAVAETVLKTKKYKIIDNNEIRIYDYLHDPAEVNYQLSNAGIRVSTICEMGDNLEDYFMDMVEKKR